MGHTHHLDTVAPQSDLDRLCQDLTAEQDALSREVLGKVAGKWPLAVLHALNRAGAPMRFTRLLEAVTGVTQKVLTQALRHLERDGFVTRRIYPQVPPKVEYALTTLGRDLVTRVDPLIIWAGLNADAFAAARRRFDDASA